MPQELQQHQPFLRSRAGALCLLFCAELLLLAVLYEFFAQIECYRLEAATTCSLLRSLVGRAISVLAMSALLVWAWPAAFARFLAASDRHRQGRAAQTVHLIGLALLLLPLLLFWGEDLGAQFSTVVLPWALGALLAAGGGLLWVAPAQAWRVLLSQDGFALVPALVVAAVLPDLSEALRPVWDWSALAGLTFAAVAWVLGLLGAEVMLDPSYYAIGVNNALGGFVVQIGPPCSGVEGFALVTGFVLIYGYIFRKDLRVPTYLLVVLPLGLLLSWGLNVIRIASLILIGAHLSPDLAVNGFHSYAGWLFFSLLALGLVWAVQSTRWLHKGGQRPAGGPPLRTDPVAAQILPFVAFLLISTALSTVLLVPELGYPLKVAVMAGALIFVSPVLRQMDWAVDPLAIAVGALVGFGWVASAGGGGDPDLATALGALGPLAFAGWVGLRLIGTVVLVPVIEELFFRGYVLGRLDGPHPLQRAAAVVISSLGFAALHGRWIEAGLAGLLFAAVALRRGRVTDAILAHVTANLIVALAAVLRGDFSLI